MGCHGRSQRLAQAGMRQDAMVRHLQQRQWLAESLCALTRRAAPPPRRHPLPQAHMQPRHERRIDPPAAHGQALRERPLCATHHAVLHLDAAPPAPRFDHRRVEQRGQRPPAGVGHRASALALRRLPPVPAMRHDGGERRGVPVA